MEGNGNGTDHSVHLGERSEPEIGAVEESAEFGIRQLKRLFQEQQQYLDYFFKHLNYEEVMDRGPIA